MENLNEKLDAAAGKALDAAMETNNFATKEDIAGLELNNYAKAEDLVNLQNQIAQMEQNNDKGVSKEVETLNTFASAFDAMEVNSLMDDANGRIQFELNAQSTFTPSAGANSAPSREDRQLEIEYDPHQMSLVKYAMQRTGTGGAYRLNTATSTSAAAGKTKGSAFGRTTKAVNDDYIPYVTVGHVLTVPKEDLNDTNQLEAYFNEEMKEELIDTLNTQFLTGSGAAGNLQGLTNWSAIRNQAGLETLFGDSADQYGTQANEIDVIVNLAAALEQDNFNEMNGEFTIFVRPALMAQIKGIKSTTGEYVLRTAWSPENNMMESFIGNVKIIKSSAVAADSFHFVHSSAIKWVTREGMSAEIGYDTDDWSRNNVSLKVYGRYALVSGKPNGIVNGTFTNAIAALNA